MSEYKMKRTEDGRAFELWQGREKVRTFLLPILPISVQDSLNMETAPLHARIAELEAKLSKIKSIANRNTGNRITDIRAILKAGDHE